MWGNHHFMGGYMWLFWIIVLIVVVLLIKWIIDSTSQKNKNKETPLEILKKRYAKGEIDKEEFEQKKKDILE